MPTAYLVTCRATRAGRFGSLNRAVNHARRLAGRHFADFSIWRGAELLCYVLAGGRLVNVVPEGWGVVSSEPESDGFFPDEEAVESGQQFWEE